MSGAWSGGASPIALHASTPEELKERLVAERAGEAHLVYRDGDGRQVIKILRPAGQTVTIGRRAECDVSLAWDTEVSRVHAELGLVGRAWTVIDDGLSRNGSFLNAERLQGRHVLRDGDTLVVGRTSIVFRLPLNSAELTTTPGPRASVRDSVSAADRQVLVALCRPLKDPVQALPASNQAIADELYVSVPAVKKRLSRLFASFQLDQLPQSEKRARLAVMALQSGIVSSRDL